jgi:hypothetical protein
LTPAYPDDALSLHRGIALLDRSRVLIQDEYQPAQSDKSLRWQMITAAKIDISADGHSAILTQGGKTLRATLLEPAAAKFEVGSTRPTTAAEHSNEGTAMLVVEMIPKTTGGATRLAVLLSPVGDKWPQLPDPTLQPLSDWKGTMDKAQ